MLENSGIQMNIEDITNKIIENELDRDNSELLLCIENILNGDDMIDKENLFYNMVIKSMVLIYPLKLKNPLGLFYLQIKHQCIKKKL